MEWGKRQSRKSDWYISHSIVVKHLAKPANLILERVCRDAYRLIYISTWQRKHDNQLYNSSLLLFQCSLIPFLPPPTVYCSVVVAILEVLLFPKFLGWRKSRHSSSFYTICWINGDWNWYHLSVYQSFFFSFFFFCSFQHRFVGLSCLI